MAWYHLFQKKQESVNIEVENLHDYIVDNTSLTLAKLHKKIKDVYIEMNNEVGSLANNLKILENAKIEGHVAEKVQASVLGNREAYVKYLHGFIDKIKTPDKVDQESSVIFTRNIHDDLIELSKKTVRNYYIAQHVFGVELEAIAKNLKYIDKMATSIKQEIDKENITIIRNIKTKENELKSKIELNEILIIDSKELEMKIKEEKENKINHISDINNIKSTKEYDRLGELETEKITTESRFKNATMDIVQTFVPLQKVLKKFQNLHKVKLIQEYIDNPTEALLHDTKFEILPYFKEMSELVNSNQIELKEKKEEQTIQVLHDITQDKLAELQNKYFESKKQLNNLKNKILSHTITEKINILENKINNKRESINSLEVSLDKVRENQSRLDIKEDKHIIENLLHKITDKKLTIN